jgi:hypothetical protein
MDLIMNPEIYEPNIDERGNYVDRCPNFQSNGIRCCCSKRDHIFDNRPSFMSHTKSKMHQKWLQDLNNNKFNYYSENTKYKEIINNQKMIIARLQKENDENIQLIAHLSKKIALNENAHLSIDLINCN